MIDGKLLIEKLIEYSKVFLHLNSLDEIYIRNTLLREFKLTEPLEEIPDLSSIKNMTVPDELYNDVKTYALENGLSEEAYLDTYATYIFGVLTPRPSEVNTAFKTIKEQFGALQACSYLYDMSIMNNYIQKTAISRNILWQAKDGNNVLEITINLSKPEKDNKEIAKLLQKNPASAKKYPKCLLCKENEGYLGTLTHPARSNLRTISINLADEKWYLQYSPYAYFEEHCIMFNDKHIPMRIDRNTIVKLLNFVDYLPNYMAGSNADLPIVGGSILNHEHYQGGKHLMPMHYAGIAKKYVCEDYPDVEVGLLDWYNTVIHLTGINRASVCALAGDVIEKWKAYSDEENQIFNMGADNVRHNTITPIVRKLPDGRYCVDLILRNNMTSEQYPDGIYHAHPEYHNIKKEGIGLIEAMGLFILPGRLKKQLAMIQEMLVKRDTYNYEELCNPENYLYVHRDMIKSLVEKNPSVSTMEKAEKITTDYINNVCKNILLNTSVYAKDEKGMLALGNFLKTLNIK